MTQVMTNPLGSKADGITPGLVCFVCTGNTCRSPMAAAVFNHLAIERNLPMRAVSAGLYVNRLEISDGAILALEAAGIPSTPGNNYRAHIAASMNAALAMRCERIVGITSSHALELMARFPQYAGKITAMPHDVSDPWGGSVARYEACLAEITAGIKKEFFHDDP